MLNNKGQSLVLFIVILPILLIILILILDVGKVIVNKQEVDNINKIVINYGLDKVYDETLNFNLLKDELVKVIKLNNDEIIVNKIEFKDNKLYIELNLKVKGMLSGLINIQVFDINSSYVGYVENNNKRIERFSGD